MSFQRSKRRLSSVKYQQYLNEAASSSNANEAREDRELPNVSSVTIEIQ